MLVSGIQQSDWVIYTHIHVYLYISFFRFFPIVGYYKISSTAPCAIHTACFCTIFTYFIYVCLLSCVTLCDPVDWGPSASSVHFPGKNTGVSCHFLLQGIFRTQGSNLYLLHCKQLLYHWATCEAPFYIQQCVFVNPKVLIYSFPLPSPSVTISLFSVCESVSVL